MSARSLKIVPWAAILALPLIAAFPESQVRAATQPAPPTQPFGYSQPGGPRDIPPYGINPPFNPPVVNGNGDENRTTNSPTDAPPSLPHEENPQTQRQQTTPAANPLDRYGDSPTTNRGDDRPRENSVPPIPSLEPLRRARELSDVPPRFAPGGPPVSSTPDNPDLHDQIERLGTSIPDAPDKQPELHLPVIGSTPVISPSPRVIRPPVALPNRRPGSGVPPANERRLVPDEVVVEIAAATPPQAIAALEQRNRLTRLDQLNSQLAGTNLLRERIQDGRTVAAGVCALPNNGGALSAPPNHLFTPQQQNA